MVRVGRQRIGSAIVVSREGGTRMRDALRRGDLRNSGEAYDLQLEFDGKEMYATRKGG